MLPLFYHDSPPHSRKSTRKALKLHFLSRQTGCTRSFFTPKPPGCGKGGKSTAFMRVLSPKTTTENCMDYPFWNELFTFSTGFSTVFVKKKRSFQRCFPPFPHSFPHPVEESPIQAVMDAAAFWKFVGKNVGNLPFYKKESRRFFFCFLQFTPAYGFAFLQSGILPRAVFHKPPGRKARCGKRTQTVIFHTVFIPAEPSQSPAATIGSRLRGLDAKNKPSRADKVPERAYKTIFYALAAAHTRVCSGAGVRFSLPLSGDTPQRRSCHP